MLDAIANSDAMQAMRDEFKNLQKKHKLTKIWADPLRKHFDTMYEEAIHRRHLTTTLVTQPLSHDKAINKITQTNKQNNKTKHEASVRDFDHSWKRLRGVIKNATDQQQLKNVNHHINASKTIIADPATIENENVTNNIQVRNSRYHTVLLSQ